MVQEIMYDLFDFITFPDRVTREDINKQYPQLNELKQIPINLLDKYNDVLVPAEFTDYEMKAKTWIAEYNHAIFVIRIPLYQMLQLFSTIKSENADTRQQPYFAFLFGYYSEQVANYIDLGFKKSLNIFNAIFNFNISNDDTQNVSAILKLINKNHNNDTFIQRVCVKLNEIRNNADYIDVKNIRNRNTHTIRATRTGLLEHHDPKSGITTISSPSKYEANRIVGCTLSMVSVLGHYSEFISKVIVEYYDSAYEEAIRNGILDEFK